MAGVEPGAGARQALLACAGLTLLALVEHTFAPWAPFYVAYAALSILVPLLALRRSPATRPAGWRLGALSWVLAVVLPVLLQIMAGLILAALRPEPSLDAAFGALFDTGARLWNTTPDPFRLAYLSFIVIWAGYGEELFYRGYLHARLRAATGRALATLISSLLFGVRHAMQLVILWPEYPWEAAGAWVLISTIAGAGFAWLYDRSGSLAPPVVAHYVFNLIPLLALLGAA